jgi:TolA-binding protein
VNERLAEQQKTMNAPIAEMGAKVNGLTDELQFVRESVAAIDQKMSKMNAQLVDLSNAIRVLQAPPPPPEAVAPSATKTDTPPAGISAATLYDDARKDMNAGKKDIAMQGFQDYLKWFDKTDYAPNAQFYIGVIQYDQANYDEAVKAFDLVLEKYPENSNKSADAMYMKGRALAQLGDKPAAAEEYRAFLKKYPRHELTNKVQAELKTVAGAPAQKKKSR